MGYIINADGTRTFVPEGTSKVQTQGAAAGTEVNTSGTVAGDTSKAQTQGSDMHSTEDLTQGYISPEELAELNGTAATGTEGKASGTVAGGTSKVQTQGTPIGTSANASGTVAGGTSNVQTQGTPIGTSANASGTVAGTEGNPAGEPLGTGNSGPNLPNVGQMLEARAQQKAAAMKAQLETEQNTRRWEPTRENIRNSGLNYVDYLRTARDNGAKIDPLETLLQYYGKDPTKSLVDAEKEERKAKARENMNLIGNALMHVGNFVGSMTSGGAVPLEDPVKYTERQRQMRERTEAMNRNKWNDVYALYKQRAAEERAEKAAELQAQRQAAQEKNMTELARLRAEEAARKAAKDAADAKLRQEELERKKAADKVKEEQGKQRTEAYVYGQHNKKTGGSGGRSGGRGGSGGGSYMGADGRMYKNIQSAVATFPASHRPKPDPGSGGIDSKSLNAAYDKYHSEKRNNGRNNTAVSQLGIRKKK